MENTNNETMYSSEAAPAPKKKSKKGLIIGSVIGGILILCAGTFAVLAATGIFNPFKKIQNTLQKATKSPLEYYKQVEGDYLDDTLSQAKEAYDNKTDKIDLEHFQYDLSASLVAESGLKTYLPLLSSGSMDLTKLESLGLGFSYGKDGNDNNFNPALLVNDQKVFSGTVYQNNEELYINVPEISNEYLNFSDAIKDFTQSEEYTSMIEKSSGLMNIIPSYDEFKKSFDNYSSIYFDSIKDVTEETEDIEASGVSGNYTVLTVKLSGEEIYTLLKAECEQLKKDEFIKSFIDNWNEFAGDDEDGKIDYNEFLSSVDEELKELDTNKDKLVNLGSDAFVMKVYVDGEGDIIGRSVTVKPEEDQEIGLNYITVIADGKYGVDYSASNNSEKVVSFTGSGKYDLANMDGDFTLTVYKAFEDSDLNIYVKYENGNTVDYIKGISSGDLTFTTDYSELKDYSVKFSFDTKELTTDYKFTLGQKEIDYVSLKIGTAISNEISSFKPSASDSVIDSNDEEKLEEYFAKFDADKILANIKDKTGVSIDTEQLIQLLKALNLDKYLGLTDEYNALDYIDAFGDELESDTNDSDLDDGSEDSDDFDYDFDDDSDDSDDIDDNSDDSDLVSSSDNSDALSDKTYTLKYIKSGSSYVKSDEVESKIHFNKDGSGYISYTYGDSTDKTSFKTSELIDDFTVVIDGDTIGNVEDGILVIEDMSGKLIYATKDADLSAYE